ncbi:unnamed protein product [Ectocarpus sp. 12 AP-2014]
MHSSGYSFLFQTKRPAQRRKADSLRRWVYYQAINYRCAAPDKGFKPLDFKQTCTAEKSGIRASLIVPSESHVTRLYSLLYVDVIHVVCRQTHHTPKPMNPTRILAGSTALYYRSVEHFLACVLVWCMRR